ncbi:MAG: biotin/lipoyl-binding protein, partial [Lentisphaerae bacterium]|nr:biotin/lipoyl-binding protein [Lentisphaerota bacterium]
MSHCNRLRLPSRIVTPALLSAALFFASCKQEEQAVTQGPPPEVSFIEIKTESVTLKKELPGRTAPYMVAEIRPQASGIITKRLFTEGTDVQMGDVLYEIDPSNYEAAKNSAEAALNVAKANHSTSIAALGAVRASLSAAKAAQSRAIANAEPLRLRTARFQELLSSKAVSQQDYDDSAAALKQAEAGIDSAEAGVISAEADIQRAEAAVKAAAAAIETAEAALAQAVINLAYTKITAPISGRI